MAWYDEAVFYHIYPLGLTGAPKQNSYGPVEHRLNSLLPWIDHIKKIGCSALYIGPLFQSVGHGYETTDYFTLDSRLGDNEDLKHFVASCHEKEIKVIFDGVFNHTGRDFFAFKDIREKREGSAYRDWYCNVNFWGNNQYNDGFSYTNWGGYDLLAKLNQRNPEVLNYFREVVRFWINEFDVDGIRLDAADVLDFDFMKMLRYETEKLKQDFWLMGEVIHGEYSRWVNEGMLHSVTNYHLHKALFSGHNDHNYFEIAHTVRRLYDMGGRNNNNFKLYNFADNHDVARIMSKLGNKANYIPVHILIYTLPGIPSLYYGSEFGIEAEKQRNSDDNLRPYLDLSEFAGHYENNPCTVCVSRLGQIRKLLPALSYGDYREAMLNNRQYVFTRSYNGTTIIVAVNNDDNTQTVRCGGIPDGDYTGALYGTRVQVRGGNFTAELYGNNGEIFIPEGYDEVCASNELKQAAEMAAQKAAEEAKRREEEKNAAIERQRRAEEAAAKAVGKSDAPVSSGGNGDACARYGLPDKYAGISCGSIASRNDYDSMSVEELQIAILEKMAKNGPVNEGMIRSVMDNVYHNSLLNWVKSFR